MAPDDVLDIQAALAAARGTSPAFAAPSLASLLTVDPTKPAVLRLLGSLMGDHGDIVVREGGPALRINRAELDALAALLEALGSERFMLPLLAAILLGAPRLVAALEAEPGGDAATARLEVTGAASALVLLSGLPDTSAAWALLEALYDDLGVATDA